jgi:hypothetical protein
MPWLYSHWMLVQNPLAAGTSMKGVKNRARVGGDHTAAASKASSDSLRNMAVSR